MPRFRPTTAQSWWGTTVPTAGPGGSTAIWLSVSVTFNVDGRLFGFRSYTSTAVTLGRWAVFVDANTNQVIRASEVPFYARASNDWQNTWLAKQYRITPLTNYRLYYLYLEGNIFETTGGLATPVTHGDILFQNCRTGTTLSPFGTTTGQTYAPGIDVLFYSDSSVA